MEHNQPGPLRDLYPHFSDMQLEEAESDLGEFLTVVMRIADRLRSEGYDLAAPDLTLSPPSPTIPEERSNPQLKSLRSQEP